MCDTQIKIKPVRETPRMNMKPARDVSEKFPRLKKKEKEASIGCVRKTLHRKIKQASDV